MTREEAIKNLQFVRNALTNSMKIAKTYDMAIKALEQEPKTGHWIEENHDEYEIWICSECGAHTELDMSEEYGCGWKFCPMCGARIESEVQDADSN